MQAFLCVATELSVIAVTIWLGFNARKHGIRWLSTLVCGMLFGLAVEWMIVHGEHPTYFYSKSFILDPGGVPLWIGIGWGAVIYSASWTAHRLEIPWGASALAAGFLAVNIDLSFDPVAAEHEFWTWDVIGHSAQCDLRGFDPADPDKKTLACHGVPRPVLEPRTEARGLDTATVSPPAPHPASAPARLWAGTAPVVSYYGVPFHNFVAWIVLVTCYSMVAHLGFRCTGKRDGATGASYWPLWAEIFVPALAVGPAFGAFYVIRLVADRFNFGTNSAVDLTCFFLLMAGSFVLFHYYVFRAKTDHPPNYPTAALPLLYHFVALGLSVIHIGRQPTLSISILMNLTVGLFAYTWPFIDSFTQKGKPTVAGQT